MYQSTYTSISATRVNNSVADIGHAIFDGANRFEVAPTELIWRQQNCSGANEIWSGATGAKYINAIFICFWGQGIR